MIDDVFSGRLKTDSCGEAMISVTNSSCFARLHKNVVVFDDAETIITDVCTRAFHLITHAVGSCRGGEGGTCSTSMSFEFEI